MSNAQKRENQGKNESKRPMKIEKITEQNHDIALVFSDKVVVSDAQDALDMAMSVSYQKDTDRIVINKESFSEEFFDLRSGMAGEVLQKFINYHIKIAIYGDFSQYTSEALKALIRESNRGRDAFFTESKEEAIQHLARLL